MIELYMEGHKRARIVNARKSILLKFAWGFIRADETIMVITPTGHETKTVSEWLLEWFPALRGLVP